MSLKLLTYKDPRISTTKLITQFTVQIDIVVFLNWFMLRGIVFGILWVNLQKTRPSLGRTRRTLALVVARPAP